MEVLSRLNAVVEYIEENLTKEIKYDEVAKLVYCSAFNFHRMFNYIVGFSVTEYVRKRRLTMAAFELQERNKKVIDIALKYGYDSPVSFARAFRSFHGVSPSEAQQKKAVLKAFPKLSFKIQISGDEAMNYRIVEKPGFRVFGLEREISHGGSDMQVPDFFSECIKDGSFDALRNLSREHFPYENMPSMSGIGCGQKGNGGTYNYIIGTLVFDNTKIPEGYAQKTIPAHTWAIFRSESFNQGMVDDIKIIQNLWKRIFQEWLPVSAYELAEAPSIEQDHYSDQDACFIEIWIPVTKS